MARDTLFSVLPPGLAEGLIGRARTVALAPDQVLFRTGDACDGCYHVIEGLLKVTVTLPSQRERILAILGAGGFGVAFSCRHKELKADVVVKTLVGDDLGRAVERLPDLLGGPNTLMIGKVLWDEFFTNSDWPLACLIGLISTPGAFMFRTNMVMPLCFGTFGSVRTIRMP